MADLDNLQASQSVKIAGADSSGNETSFVNSTVNGDLQTIDILNTSGTQGSLIVGTSAVEVKVGVSRFSNRKVVTLYNNSNETIYWGFTNSITISSGTPIEKKEFIVWNVGDDLSIWVIAGTSSIDTRITEAS